MALPAATDYVPEPPPERVPSDSRPSELSRSRSPWRKWLWLLAIVVVARVVLAIVLVPLAERTLSRVLATRVDVGDVSFAPIDAVFTLRNVAVHADAADATPGIRADRVRIDVQWLPLLHRSLVVRLLALEGAHVDVERLRGAGWTLERLQQLEPATELPPGWSFALDRIALRDTHVRSRDVGADDAAVLDVTVRDARASVRRQRASAFGRAPNLRVDAQVDGGRLLITGTTDLRDAGVAIDARVDLKDAPLERFAAYGPVVAGSSTAGRVSGRLHYQRDPGRRDRLTGRLRGRRVAVHVPALAEPALAIRRVEAAVDGIDLLQRRVAIGTLTLYGARLAVRPDLLAPVPLLDGLAPASAEPSAPRRGARPAPRTPTWIWTVAHFESPFARLLVAGSPEEPWLAANVSGENLGPGAYWSPVRAWIDWGAGTAVFDGTARMTRGFLLEGRVTASDIDAVAVARAVGPPLATLVQAGRAAADLNVELAFGEAKDQPLDFRGKVDATVPPLDLRGRITVADLWLAGPDPSAFAFGARALDLELARVAPAKDGSRQLEIGFASAALESPYLTLTRTAEEAAVDVAAAPAPAAPADAMPAVTLAVADVRARNGRLLVVDEVATPHLALDLATIDGWGRELRLPALGMGEFVVQGSDRRLGALRLAGALGRGDLVGELSAPAVNLTAVSPYLQRARLPYVFTSGTGAVRSHVAFAGHYWSADTTVTLVEPTLGGDAGVLEQSLGMPAAAAFDELRERHGEVSLRVPLGSAGWAGGRWLNEMVASAMREALARPRLAPLPEAPIGFAAGRTEAGPQAGRQLAAIADALAARPNVVVEVRGAISSDDRRWFAEQALGAEDTDEPRGISGWLRAVGFRGQHDRIRDALAARAAGRPGRLDSADEAALRDLVAARPPIADERLTSLAAERATLVANALADRHGVDAERVVVATTQTETEALAPVVEVRFRPRPEPAPW